MDPVSVGLGIAGAGGQILGAVQGMQAARAQRDFNNAQIDLAFRNFYLQRQVANQQRDMATAGQRDARGNTLEYVPGYGWVERAAPMTQRLINAGDQEDLARLTTDAVRSRMQRGQQFQRQMREGAEADALLAGAGEGTQSLDDVRALLANRNTARAMSGINNARRGIQLNMLRGGSGGETALAELSRAGINDTRTALADAAAEAGPEFVSRRGARLGNALGAYGAMANRASQPLDGPAPMSNAGSELGRRLSGQQQTGAFLLGNAGRVQPPQRMSLDTTGPTAVGSLGSTILEAASDPKLAPIRNWLSSQFSRNRGASYNPNTYGISDTSPI